MSYWKEKVIIKGREFPRFMGAPLDGVTDSPFRKLVRKFSKDELLYTEMRHVAAVANDPTNRPITFEVSERPLNFQFSANNIDFIEKACDKVLQKGVDSVDLNIGCPAKHTVGSGSGSALMNDIPQLKQILKLFRGKITDIPFTVKMRAGFKKNNALEVAQLLQDHGVDAIAIHPRLQSQKFAGIPDYSVAEAVKQQLDIPVLFSGGIVDFQSAKQVYEQTGVDGFLIGRGMWSKPWKLKELQEHAEGNAFVVDNSIVLQCALDHLDNVLDFYGANGIYIFRKHLCNYIKGLPFACDLKEVVMKSEAVKEVKDSLIKFLG